MTTIIGGSAEEVKNVQPVIQEEANFQIQEESFKAWVKERIGDDALHQKRIFRVFADIFRINHNVKTEAGSKISLNMYTVQAWRESNEMYVLESERNCQIPLVKKVDDTTATERKMITKALIEQFKASQFLNKAFPEEELNAAYFDKAAGLTQAEMDDLVAGLTQGGKYAITFDEVTIGKPNLTRRALVKAMTIPAVVEGEPKFITHLRDVHQSEPNMKAAGAGFFGF